MILTFIQYSGFTYICSKVVMDIRHIQLRGVEIGWVIFFFRMYLPVRG
jgi:hypothetical protein